VKIDMANLEKSNCMQKETPDDLSGA